MAALQVTRAAYALGAQVTGIDLRDRLTDADIAGIRQAVLDNLVVCFPRQEVDQAALLRLGQAFGEIEPASKENVDPDAPTVTLLTNKSVDGRAFSGYQSGQNWHSDHSYTTQPTLYSFLASKEIPPVGGDTMFANMYAAYETLSKKMQAIIDGLEGIHVRALPPSFRVATNADRVANNEQRDSVASAGRRPAAHRVARIHPETGRTALYLGQRVRRFVGMTEEESRPLIEFLNMHAVRYEFTYRHRWSLGDVVMWDNRCTMHIAVADYDLQHDARSMLRCSVKGEPSGYEFSGNDDAPVYKEDPVLAHS
jgi:taurine dioxygenase